MLNLLRGRNAVNLVLMGLIELVEVSKLRSKILIVTIRATTISQAIAVNTRHYHYIV